MADERGVSWSTGRRTPRAIPGLGLAAQAEEEQVVAGEDRVGDLRQHGLAVAEQAGEDRVERLAGSQSRDQLARSSAFTERGSSFI